MYRPQFAYRTPAGFTDQDFSYSFDGATNTPLLAGTIGGNTFIQNIMLPLQPDQMFLWRGWKIQTYNVAFEPLFFQFKDPCGNYLSQATIPSTHWYLPPGQQGWGFQTVPIEPEIPCPAGSNVVLYIQTQPFGGSVALPRVVLYGVKRGPTLQH